MKLVRTAFAVAFLAAISVFCAGLVPRLPFLAVAHSLPRLRMARRLVLSAVRSWMPLDLAFVELNGGACRLAGRRLCNQRILCENDVVCEARKYDPCDPCTVGCAYVRQLNRCCMAMGVPFVVVIAPSKVDSDMAMFRRGGDSGDNRNKWAHARCEEFKEEGIETVDLTSCFTATADDVRRNFFKTDHHWNVPTAFKAAHITANVLSKVLSEPLLMDHPNLNSQNWEWRVLKDSFVGSHGRRTGEWFSGCDDFVYPVPLFETHIARKLFRTGVVWEGPFEESVLTKSVISGTSKEHRYSIVGGGDDEWQRLQSLGKDRRMLFKNLMAPSDKRVFISRDSFGVPFSAFMSTLFKELLVNDPRNMPRGVVEEQLIADFKPDLVVRIIYADSLIGKKSQSPIK